jgi:hypothetical protein
MELDDFKKAWNEKSYQGKEKQNLALKAFDKMGHKKIRSKLFKIIFPELLGSIVCFGSAIFIESNFDKLDKPTYQIIGAIGILLSVLLSIIGLMGIRHLYKMGAVDKLYLDTIKDFATQKINFCKWQKLNLRLSYLLLVIVVLLFPKFFEKSGITDSKHFFLTSLSLGFCFLLIFSEWVVKSYSKTIRQTEDMLKELLT